ncbi:MAG: hypothetical protein JOZ69_17600 [Myxococcales bacterium]|nr:hypothetical protein [Myxococcales bacterium]
MRRGDRTPRGRAGTHPGHLSGARGDGARDEAGFFLVDELLASSRASPNFRYRRCALMGAPSDGIHVGPLDDVLVSEGEFAGRRVFLCGDPDLVQRLRRRLFLAGAALRQIHADAFVSAAP